MHLSISFFLSLSALFVATTVAQSNQTDYSVRCLRFPPSVAGNHTFNPDAITALSTALSDNSFNPALPADGIKLAAGTASRVGWGGNGGYQVCLQNFYFFKSVTVPLKDLSAAVAAIENTCCNVNGRGLVPGTGGRQGKCQDAKAIVKSTDGDDVKVVGQDYGDRCCGMWKC